MAVLSCVFLFWCELLVASALRQPKSGKKVIIEVTPEELSKLLAEQFQGGGLSQESINQLLQHQPQGPNGLTEERVNELNDEFKGASIDKVLKYVVQQFPGVTAQFSSFGPSGLVITDRLASLGLLTAVPVVTVDTLHLFEESYDFYDVARKKYPSMNLHIYQPKGYKLGEQQRFDADHGKDLWKTDFQRYTYLTKVEPTDRALEELNVHVWITGRRRSEGGERERLQVFELADGRLKVNPAAEWTPEQVWGYIKKHDLPYNPLYDKGYASLGDSMNTRPIEAGEGERAGRFVDSTGHSTQLECGMHSPEETYEALKSEEELPQVVCEHCTDVTTDTFEEVLKETKPFLIEFFSPTCRHCQAFAPNFDAAAAALVRDGRLKVFRMDMFRYTVPEAGRKAGFELHAIPAVFLVRPDGKGKRSLETFTGWKSTEGVLSWVSEHAGFKVKA